MKKREGIEVMSTTAAELIQFIQAAHVGQQTDWGFTSSGGIILVASPEGLKTTVVERALEVYPNAEVIGDVNARKLGSYRDRLLSGRYRTLAFTDYQKVWERDQDTAANVEGIVRMLTDEGWRGHSENSEFSLKARALCVLCVPPAFAERNYQKWEQNGFARRFVILQYQFAETDVLVDAIGNNRPFQLSPDALVNWPANGRPMIVTDQEFEYLKLSIKDQFGVLIPLQFCKRILNTLKWHYRERVADQEKADEYAQRVFMGVCPLMRKGGGLLVAKNPRLALVSEESAANGKQKRKPAAAVRKPA